MAAPDGSDAPVVEPPPNGEAPDLTRRALQQRIRQQEILAELGVIALQGASFDQLLSDTARLTAEGTARRILQGSRIYSDGKQLPCSCRSGMESRNRRCCTRRR